jgi:hypothetical protein
LNEQAYQRGDLFEERRRLMLAWDGYCVSKVDRILNPPADNVRSLRAGLG